MENDNSYLDFNIPAENNFGDLKHAFELFKEAKNFARPKPEEFWLDHFPAYALKQFYFLENDKKPPFRP